MSMLDSVVSCTSEYILQMPKSLRKSYGQFFTSKETAVFMASLFDLPQNIDTLSILDPGAGSGILAAALIDRIQSWKTVRSISLTCYENDPSIMELLKSNLELIKKSSAIELNYSIVTDNYITSQSDDYNNMLLATHKSVKYDLIIGNPPYMKIAKDAEEALSMPDICYGAPNLYFLFSQMALFNLKTDREMVFIIPRSWTSGAYFRAFRSRFLTEGALQHIHLFVSRDKVFEQESVLQETIIIKVKKSTVKPNNITITTTQSNSDFSNATTFEAPYNIVVSGKENYVFLVTNEADIDALMRWLFHKKRLILYCK